MIYPAKPRQNNPLMKRSVGLRTKCKREDVQVEATTATFTISYESNNTGDDTSEGINRDGQEIRSSGAVACGVTLGEKCR